MELFLIYLWLKLDLFVGIGYAAFALLAIVFFVSLERISTNGGSYYRAEREQWTLENLPGWKRIRNCAAAGAVAFLFCSLLTPSSKDVAILVGASIALDVARSPEGAKVASILRGKANEILDTELKKLSTGK